MSEGCWHTEASEGVWGKLFDENFASFWKDSTWGVARGIHFMRYRSDTTRS